MNAEELEERLAKLTTNVNCAEIDAALAAVPFEESRASFNNNPLYVARLIRHILDARIAQATVQ